ncbi:MAG TPA: phenylalanine--tRNA ligase subunit alpha [Chloroflexi bacterium]|jgi:phenylalanyl-tRNA synthetase alpha chain|nr:phenylalanine--tRNA ligase subunit alpha [Chloroflexota bacterium]
MLHDLERIKIEARAALDDAADLKALESWRLAYLGKKGALTLALRGIGRLPAEERPVAGQRANEVRQELEAAFEERQEQLESEAIARELAADAIDVRLPGRPQSVGHLHISTQTLREIYDIFGQMGFQVLRSPDVEDDETNFQMLNIPPHHPARDMWSTFYTTCPGVLLRTHTSPGQIHAMRKFHPAPIRVILPGKCYRYEQVSVRSEQMFHQVEGLVVGHNITMADLKGTLVNFARQMFGAERRLRFRPSYFPFTEPSAEADMDCFICGGKGCAVCKYTGWVEILGCGMVHPNVLRNGGYDPDEWSGFAFGMGPERIAMLKSGITDIRLFFGNDLRFLQQFA